MKIKQIELSGFKSFSDKAVLNLSQPITAVVGPNGCGKSNIVDALLWAMGEQRARHLRGKTMEDVIFNGSDGQGPAGLAEVSITFENDGRAPLEFRDYSEITVTRRLHRDGTSEYLINKLPVRLRDVTNLFLGTGVGTRAYSIIEQGRVGMIVSAKPEDRRHFIEEAAGITKYRRRKQAAERKMDATRQNLLRVSDVLEEIGKRLGSLRRQAQKAERYKRYKNEMRGIELRSSAHRYLGLLAENKVVTARQEVLREDRDVAELELSRGEVSLEAARSDAMEQERALSQAQEALYALDNRIKLGESQRDYQRREAADLLERADSARQEIANLETQLADAEARREAVAARVLELSEERARLEEKRRVSQAVYDRFRGELRSFDGALEGEREEVSDADREIARGEADLRALRQRREDLGERRQRQLDEGERVLTRLEALGKAAVDIDGELGQLRQDLDRLMRRREDAIARLDELRETARHGEAQLEVLRTELHRRKSRLTSLEEIQARYEGFGEGTRAIMQRHNGHSAERGVLAVVADLVEAPVHYETALEAVLGQRLGTVVVADESVGVEAISYLKDEQKGRGSFIARFARGPGVLESAPVGVVWDAMGGAMEQRQDAPIARSAPRPRRSPLVSHEGVHGPILGLVNYNKEYRKVAETLLGDVVVVEDLPRALEVWDVVDQETLVTLDGELLAPDGTVTGGSKAAEMSGVLRQKREIKELMGIIEDLQERYEGELDAHVAVKTEIAALEQILDEVTRDGHHSDKEILTREKDLGRISSENVSLVGRREEMEREAARLADEMGRLSEREVRLNAFLKTRKGARHVGRDILALLRIARERLAVDVDVASGSLTDAKVALAQAVAAYDASAGSLLQLEEMTGERRQRIEDLAASSADGLERAETLRQAAETLREEIEALVEQRVESSTALATGRQEHEEHQAALMISESQLKIQRSRVTEIGLEQGKLDVKFSELTSARSYLEEQVWGRYRERIAEALFDFHLDPPVTEQELERLEQLRQLIDRMGEINLTAIDEFNELDARHRFLGGHKDDLEDALGQLQRAIQKINRTSRKRFVETFDDVNAKFQEVFPRLFRGGRGKLVLTESDDILDAGVDIIAQPPGKKLASMDVMSGGEKALTATSLIFAMFLVKPTPFCLLDEVDAPLDEANVVRLRDMIREMSAKSQFIVITHNRNTMEVCDRLYGVTMEVPGVSKIVSVNLTEAQEVAA
ncbi:MAG: chromosome segregation protein SMC [Deltaproteobacteria bacterium]|nr:chromosome segregation protein SMC [Deltaproteobacteria bacterium]